MCMPSLIVILSCNHNANNFNALHFFQEVPFPSEEEMQTNLQNYISWKEHRSNTYKTSVNKAVTKRHKKKWARPQYIGQYDFRTGPI